MAFAGLRAYLHGLHLVLPLHWSSLIHREPGQLGTGGLHQTDAWQHGHGACKRQGTNPISRSNEFL